MTHTRPRRNALEWAVAPLGSALTRKRAGVAGSVANAPELAPKLKKPLRLTSHSIAPGGEIPGAHTALPKQRNISPDLEWSKVPARAQQLLLIVEDTDVPFARPFIHTIALLPPTTPHLDDGDLEPDNPDVRFVPGSRRRAGYYGPRPFPGHGRHHYGFHLFALDTTIEPDADLRNLNALLPLVAGHVLTSGVLVGYKEG